MRPRLNTGIRRSFVAVVAAICTALPTLAAASASNDAVTRMDADAKAGTPLVAHVIVALCDNWHQRIVPVPMHLGDGDDPASNLYWGAMYGVKTFFRRHENWQPVVADLDTDDVVLDRVIFSSTIERAGHTTPVFVVAEAWRGRHIKQAIAHFLDLTAGHNRARISVEVDGTRHDIDTGGAAHIVAYVGHNGLMDFPASPAHDAPNVESPARSSIVLACESHDYFDGLLRANESHELLTTTGLMAPEAYTLEAAVTAWFRGESATTTRDLAAAEYARFQKANPAWSRKLFATSE